MVRSSNQTETMSFPQGSGTSGEDISGFYETIPPEWTGVETPAFPTPYLNINAPYCSGPMVPPPILTPISLPNSSSSYRPSPAPSRQSQDYSSQDYRYNINDAIQPQGLGISAPFPSDFPRTTAPHPHFSYAPDNLQYGPSHTPAMSPQGPASKRLKRTLSTTLSRDTPVNIQPHPEGIQRMERERQSGLGIAVPQPRPRAPGRGRRDPQAEVEDAFVEALRAQNHAWKVVREMFRQRFDKDASEARLQMRLLRRRKERLTRWDDHDVRLLINAHELWEENKFRFISEKMKELGCTKEYTPEQCRSQLHVLEAKQLRDMGSVSPSAMSDPPHSPPVQPASRKRARPWDEPT